jgi:TatD family-associated radical SAM protein
MEKEKPSIVYWLGDNLYLNVANQCSNNCYFCFRNYKDGISNFSLKLTHDPTAYEVIENVKDVINKRQWREIVFCGFGEPLIRLDTVLEVACWLKKYHASINIRVDTNGQAQLFYKDRNVIDELKRAGVDRVSVSLNAHNQQIYDQICKPKFENAYAAVLNFIEAAKDEFDTEVTAVTIPEADLLRIEQIASDLRVKFRKRDYIPCFW